MDYGVKETTATNWVEGLLVAGGHGGVVRRRHKSIALWRQRRVPHHLTTRPLSYALGLEFCVWPAVFWALACVLLFF